MSDISIFLIFITDINFTRFRPSVIAASAILVGGRLLFDNLLYKINKMILLASSYVNKVKKSRNISIKTVIRMSPCLMSSGIYVVSGGARSLLDKDL